MPITPLDLSIKRNYYVLLLYFGTWYAADLNGNAFHWNNKAIKIDLTEYSKHSCHVYSRLCLFRTFQLDQLITYIWAISPLSVRLLWLLSGCQRLLITTIDKKHLRLVGGDLGEASTKLKSKQHGNLKQSQCHTRTTIICIQNPP